MSTYGRVDAAMETAIDAKRAWNEAIDKVARGEAEPSHRHEAADFYTRCEREVDKAVRQFITAQAE